MSVKCCCGCGSSTTSGTVSGNVSSSANLKGRIYAPTYVSAYSIAVQNGFEGTVEEWLASLHGKDGKDGESAYQLDVDNGFEGTLEEWLEQLHGRSDHSQLLNRDAKDSHPMSAITHLEDTLGYINFKNDEQDQTLDDIEVELDKKLENVANLSDSDILDICK